jgi:hypothetical protein
VGAWAPFSATELNVLLWFAAFLFNARDIQICFLPQQICEDLRVISDGKSICRYSLGMISRFRSLVSGTCSCRLHSLDRDLGTYTDAKSSFIHPLFLISHFRISAFPNPQNLSLSLDICSPLGL